MLEEIHRYVHSYQSYLWNHAVSKRITLFGEWWDWGIIWSQWSTRIVIPKHVFWHLQILFDWISLITFSFILIAKSLGPLVKSVAGTAAKWREVTTIHHKFILEACKCVSNPQKSHHLLSYVGSIINEVKQLAEIICLAVVRQFIKKKMYCEFFEPRSKLCHTSGIYLASSLPTTS